MNSTIRPLVFLLADLFIDTSHPVSFGRFFQIIFFFQPYNASKSYARETVGRGLKNISFHALLTPVVNPNLGWLFKGSFWGGGEGGRVKLTPV